MIKFIFLFLFFQTKELTLQKFDISPEIDGVISPEEWGSFNPIIEFFEIQPEEGKVPPVKTECYIGYDNKNIYIAFKCYDDMKTVRKTLTKRDEIAMDDMVIVFIDTYG
ncbi:MAG: hypothetical protein ABIM57_03380, partial [candidate division WOR-3 bacterium]